jgi:hypothetical protein
MLGQRKQYTAERRSPRATLAPRLAEHKGAPSATTLLGNY